MNLLEWLRTDPIAFFTFMLYRAPAVLIALTLHEIAHGYVAYRCGDSTAHDMGRLSLNPLAHLDLVGTLFMFFLGFGWAKPVPVNSSRFRNLRRDDLFVSLAGVTTNFILFFFAMLAATALNEVIWDKSLWNTGYPLVKRIDFLGFSGVNFYSILYSENVVFVKEAVSEGYYYITQDQYLSVPWLLHVQRFVYQFAQCNLGMCLFNLLPFPPLDGFHVFNDILLRGKLKLNGMAFRISMIALLLLSFSTNIFSSIISKAIYAVQGGVLSMLLSFFRLQ